MTDSDSGGFRSKKAAILALLILIGFLTFGQCLSFGFILDDELQIVRNPIVQSLSNILTFFSSSTLHSGGASAQTGLYYKPLMTLFYTFLWNLSGGNASFFHGFQGLLHIGNAFLLFLFLDNCSKQFSLKTYPVFLAFLFLVHPMNTETVVYIADLQDVLFTFFGLLSLNLCIKKGPLSSKDTGILFFLFLFSLLSKETALLYIFSAVLMSWMFDRSRMKQIVASSLMALLIYLYLRIGVAHLSSLAHNNTHMFQASFTERFQSIPKILWHYLSTFFYPKDLVLTQDWIVTSLSLKDFWFPLLIILVLFSMLALRIVRKKDRWMTFFFLWTLAGFALHCQIVPLDGTVADRWIYFPMIGLLGLTGIGLRSWISLLPADRLNRAFVPFLGCLLVLLCSLRSYARTLNWETGLTLYSHDLQVSPDSYYLNANLGLEYLHQGNPSMAKPLLERSTILFPASTANWSNLGVAHEMLGDFDAAERCYLRAIQNGGYYLAYENYGIILFKRHKFTELADFLEKSALKSFPNNPILNSLKGKSLMPFKNSELLRRLDSSSTLSRP